MEAKQFLSENRQVVIDYYNNEIAGSWSISLKDFMVDVITNFEKITTGEEFKKFDLMGNLSKAKSRLGMYDACTVVAEDKVTNALRAKYKGTAFMAMV